MKIFKKVAVPILTAFSVLSTNAAFPASVSVALAQTQAGTGTLQVDLYGADGKTPAGETYQVVLLDAKGNPVTDEQGNVLSAETLPQVMGKDKFLHDLGVFQNIASGTYTLQISSPDGYIFTQTVSVTASKTSKPIKIVLAEANDSTGTAGFLDLRNLPYGTKVQVKSAIATWTVVNPNVLLPLPKGTYTVLYDMSQVKNDSGQLMYKNKLLKNVSIGPGQMTSPIFLLDSYSALPVSAAWDVKDNVKGKEKQLYLKVTTAPYVSVTVTNSYQEVVGAGKADKNGNCSITFKTPQSGLLTVTVADEAGNTAKTTFDVGADTTPPTFTADSSATSASATLTVHSNEDGTAYFVVLPASAKSPSAAQVVSGQDASGNSVSPSGSFSVNRNQDTSYTITGLSSQTSYGIYVVVQDNSSNLSAVKKISFTTWQNNVYKTARPTSLFALSDQNKLYGTAEPSASITVSKGNQSVTGSADANGKIALDISGINVQNGDTVAVTAQAVGKVASDPVTVTVGPSLNIAYTSQLKDLSVPQGTSATQLQLPTSIKIVLNDWPQTSFTVPVTWDTSTYDGNTPNTYTLSGDLDLSAHPEVTNPSNLKAQVKITVNSLKKSQQPTVSGYKLTITGTADPNALIKVKDASGNVLGTVAADNKGNYSVQVAADSLTTLQNLQVTSTAAPQTESDAATLP